MKIENSIYYLEGIKEKEQADRVKEKSPHDRFQIGTLMS